MNTFTHVRQLTFAIALLLIASLSSCKKGSEIEPKPADLNSRVAGQYAFSELVKGGKTYPASATNIKGNVTVKKMSTDLLAITVDLKAKSNNEEFINGTVSNLTATESNGTIEYRDADGDLVARGSGKTISIDGTDENGDDFTITAAK